MDVERYLEGLKRMGVEYQPKDFDEYQILQKVYVLDTICYELGRFAKISLAIAHAIDKLCNDVFAGSEIVKTTDEYVKVAEMVTQDMIKDLGKNPVFDIGVTTEGIRKLESLLNTTIEDLGQGNLFNVVLVPYLTFVYSVHVNISKHILGFEQKVVDMFKEGCKYFEEKVYGKYFDKMKKGTTLQNISVIINLMALLATLADSLANAIANKLRDEIMQLGGVPYGEKPSD